MGAVRERRASLAPDRSAPARAPGHTHTAPQLPWLADPRAGWAGAAPGDVLTLQRVAGNRATAQRAAVQRAAVQRAPTTQATATATAKTGQEPVEAEASGVAPPVAWIDSLPTFITSQIDTFSQDYFDKQPEATQQKLLSKRAANRTTFMINMAPYLGSFEAVERHFKEIVPVMGLKEASHDLWLHQSTKDRLLAVKADVEAKGSPMPRTTVGQSLRGRHLHPESKAPGAGMLTHAMGFAIDWRAYATPHVTDPRLHALFETVTDRKPALNIGVGWTERHNLIQEMGRSDTVSEKGQALLDKIEKDFADLARASDKFKADLPESSLAPLRELEAARWAIAEAEGALKKLKKRRHTKDQVAEAKQRIVDARARFDELVPTVKAQLAAIFKPWTDKLDARIASIDERAAAAGVNLDRLTGQYGFKELGGKLAALQRQQRPHVTVARAVLAEVHRIVRTLQRVTQRIDAAEAWLAAPGKRAPDPADAERWTADLAELRTTAAGIRDALEPVQSSLETLLPGAKVRLPEPKPSRPQRVTDATVAHLRKALDPLSGRVEGAKARLDKVHEPLAALVGQAANVAADIADRKAYAADTATRLGAGNKKAGQAAVKAWLQEKLKLTALKGAKEALLSDAGGFVMGAKNVKNPAITQLLGLMGGTTGGGFVTVDAAGPKAKEAADKKEWSKDYGFNTTFVVSMVRHGFELGVAWEQSPDTMHFELVDGRRQLEGNFDVHKAMKKLAAEIAKKQAEASAPR